MTTAGGAARITRHATRFAYAATAQALYLLAALWRRLLVRTTFIAITGTHGKTTTKEMVATILATSGRTLRSRGNENTGLSLSRNVLRVRPWHRFAVLEIGIGAPGEMRRLARLVRPDVAVVLGVLRAHTHAFPDPEAHAREKAMLLRALRRGGTAVLNADDPRVAAMAVAVEGPVLRIGTSPGLDAWAENVSARWPRRLAFDLRTGDGDACRVATRLVGAHWAVAAVAALALGRRLGVPLRAATDALAAMDPFPGRLQPVALPSGAIVLRDDYDGSIEAWDAALAVLAGARAARRIAVVTDASDYGTAPRRKRLAQLGREAARSAEVVVFVGENAVHGRAGALAAGLLPENAHACEDLGAAARLLSRTLRAGDLALLKGWFTDHLGRLLFALLGPITCTRVHCDKPILCDACAELGAAPADRARARVVPPPLDEPGETRRAP